MKDAIQDSQKGTRTLRMKGVHDSLTLIIQKNEDNPRETEEKEQSIKNEKGGNPGGFAIFIRAV